MKLPCKNEVFNNNYLHHVQLYVSREKILLVEYNGRHKFEPVIIIFLALHYPHIAGLAELTWEPSIRNSVPIKTLPFPTFRQILKALCAELRNYTPHYASLPERGNENINYFISRVGF